MSTPFISEYRLQNRYCWHAWLDYHYPKSILGLQTVIPTSELGVRKYIFYLVNNSFILYDGIKEIYFIDLIIFKWKKLQMEDQVINNYRTSTCNNKMLKNKIILCFNMNDSTVKDKTYNYTSILSRK